MSVIVDIKSFKTKLTVSFIILLTFLVLYKTIPPEEFGISSKISNTDLLYNTVLTHAGISRSKLFDTKTLRAKIIVMSHVILSYILLLM